MPPFTVQRIDHLVLRVADSARAERFYREVLGCRVARRREDLGLVHLAAGASMIDLVALDGPLGRRGAAAPAEDGRNLDHLCLRVDPFDEDALRAHLAVHGVEPLAPVAINFGAEGEGPSLYVRDPEGNVVELKGAATTTGDR
jgi:catechol 2,3-dioxygenase-like lactoylglutathione lyase family enzyme